VKIARMMGIRMSIILNYLHGLVEHRRWEEDSRDALHAEE